MGDNELINRAFFEIQSEGLPEIGSIVGTLSGDPLSYTLEDIIDEIAVCGLPDGTIKHFQLDELADVNKVRNRAIELMIDLEFDTCFHRLN